MGPAARLHLLFFLPIVRVRGPAVLEILMMSVYVPLCGAVSVVDLFISFGSSRGPLTLARCLCSVRSIS